MRTDPAPRHVCGPKLPAAPGATRRASGQYCAVYYRFHSVPELYKWHYSPEFLARIAAEVKAAKHEKQVYLFFNNGIGAVGMENARQMQQWL